jgi:thiol-disulfide isomerase/thioredoxin
MPEPLMTLSTHFRKPSPTRGRWAAILAAAACVFGWADAARAQYPWVGIWMGKDKKPGVGILAVFKGSPAANAGIQRGDRLMAVAGRPVNAPKQVLRIVRFHRIGSLIKMKLVRANMPFDVDVVLGTRPKYVVLLKRMWVGRTAPNFTIKSVVASNSIELKKLRGKVVLLEFWAIWCTACRVAVATLKRWQRVYVPRGLTIISVGKDKAPNLVQFARTRQIPYFVGQDSGWLSRLYRISPIPAFILIDRKGKVRDIAVGLGVTFKGLERKLQNLLAKKASKVSKRSP